jgi:hypothetical protein
MGRFTYVGVEQTQDELEVRLLAGDERHLCGVVVEDAVGDARVAVLVVGRFAVVESNSLVRGARLGADHVRCQFGLRRIA